MNQNKATSGTKLGGRDFINLGIFTVIFIVIFYGMHYDNEHDRLYLAVWRRIRLLRRSLRIYAA